MLPWRLAPVRGSVDLSVCALKREPQGRGWGCCYAMGELPWNQEGGWRQKRKKKKRRRNEEMQVSCKAVASLRRQMP